MIVEQDVKFDHDLHKVPLEIMSNTPKGTNDKYVWFQGTIANPISTLGLFSLAIAIKDNSAWLADCNGPGEVFFDPEPTTTEVVWTVFKTSKEMVFECNGVFCLKYSYSDSKSGDIRCNTFKQPSLQMFFVKHDGNVAEQYRASGTCKGRLFNSLKPC